MRARAAGARTPIASDRPAPAWSARPDRKSTRLNSSHSQISYAVFCLKKKNKTTVRLRGQTDPGSSECDASQADIRGLAARYDGYTTAHKSAADTSNYETYAQTDPIDP